MLVRGCSGGRVFQWIPVKVLWIQVRQKYSLFSIWPSVGGVKMLIYGVFLPVEECKKASKGKLYWRWTTTWSSSFHLWTLFTDFFCLEDKTSCTAVWEQELLFTSLFLSHLCLFCTPWPCLSLTGCSTSYTEESYCTVLRIAPPHTQWGDGLQCRNTRTLLIGLLFPRKTNSAATFRSWTLWTITDKHICVADEQTWVYDQ